MSDFVSYVKTTNGNATRYTFYPLSSENQLPQPVDAALAIVMIADSYVVVQKPNNEWDIVGGKLESSESIVESIVREVKEEAGVSLDTESRLLLGYIESINENGSAPELFHEVNYMPVFLVYAQAVNRGWTPPKDEIIARRLVSYKKLAKLFESRKDGGQLMQIIDYAKESVLSMEPVYTFDFESTSIVDESKGPVTQVMAFCKDSEGKYCVVRDGDEDYFSLPGGGCELDETPDEAIAREVLEEAQIVPDHYSVLGTVQVTMKLENKIISRSQHIRYLCSINGQLQPFIAGLGGFETVERSFIDKSQLGSKVMLLNNKTGEDIIACL